ncbi:MAG TPA: cytidine deaminase [Chthoniobacterales bacterium]|nr:cytidine deaminase [Chthoniobacterales bacterium]
MDNRQRLIEAAKEARERAHVVYSEFPVGAALLTRSGQIFKGCNIENISLRLTLCAEEVAMGTAVVSGDTELVAIAVVADSESPVMPCGACRQMLAEFNPELEIISATPGGRVETYSLSELLPRPKQGIMEHKHGD